MAITGLKQNDTVPLHATLTDASGAVDLTAATVRFAMKQRGGEKSVVHNAVITDAASGKVRVDWQAGDLDTPGDYIAEFEVTFADDTVQTFPADDYRRIRVLEEVAT